MLAFNVLQTTDMFTFVCVIDLTITGGGGEGGSVTVQSKRLPCQRLQFEIAF